MAGRCWGLFLLPAAVAQLTATDFVPYYNYDGDLAVAGTVTVTTDGTSQTLEYELTGTEFACTGGADSSADNSCGVHIHSGTACDGDAGGHYYDDELVASDPWGSITYVTAAFPPSDTTDSVDTGYTEADLVGRALIIHGYDGGRIACALLTAPAPAPSSAPTLAPYALDWDFGMDPQLSVAAGTTVTFTWTGGHNVWEMPNEADFNNCDFGSSTNLGSSSGVSVGPVDGSTKYYGCEEPGHCTSGQKIAITWAAAPTAAPVFAPTPRPSAAATPAPTNSSAPTPRPTTTAPAPTNASASTPAPVASAQTQPSASPTPAETQTPTGAAVTDAPAPAPTSGEFSAPVPTAAPVQMPTAETVVINSQLVLEQVPDTMDAATLEIVVKNALVATLTSVTSTDQIVAFSVVSSRRRRLQQSTTTVAFSVRVEGSAEFAASYAETIVSDLSTAAQSGALNTALATAADAEGAVGPTAPAAANDYDTIMAATVVDGAPTPQPVAPTPAPSRRPTPQPVQQPTRRPTPRPTAATAGMEEEDGSEDQGEDQGEDESEDKGADSASGGLAVLGIALAAFLGLLCVGGYVRMKMFGSQDRSDRDWARDLHGSGVSNPAAARDPWGRPTPSETRGVEMASTHGLRSYH